MRPCRVMTSPRPGSDQPLLHFEDFKAGDVHQLGSRTITREEMLAFARAFDPQPFHIDEEAARTSIYGGLIASGWHTASLCFRLAVDSLIGHAASLGAPGVEEVRWLKPVRPGDTLHVRAEVLETRPSRSKPDRGAVHIRYDAFNQRDEHVFSMHGWGLFARSGRASP